MASGADTLANSLLSSLTAGKSFPVPDINVEDPIFDQPGEDGDIYAPIPKLTNEDLTTGAVGGAGVFDALMKSLTNHLKVEYQANRISGAEYTKTYQALVGAALQTATQYLLGKDQAYWQAILAQRQAQIAEIQKTTARLELENARANLVRAKYEAANAEATYALTKIKLATEDATFGNLEKQGEILALQKTGVQHDNTGKEYTNAQILPLQKILLTEQGEVQRAQTMNNRSDGQVVTGVLGKQKDLYTQQITSYQHDAATKVAKIYSDAFITQKTIDEGTVPPTQFTAANINTVIQNLRNMVNLGS